MFIHEDDRRKLIDWSEGSFKACKVLVTKKECTVGDHYHRNKDEHFLLVSGMALAVEIGNEIGFNWKSPCVFHVPRGTYHRFRFSAGSILVGVTTEEFDPADEIAGRPCEEKALDISIQVQ